MVYKIALVSTHGTGKTSLAASVQGQLKSRGIETKLILEKATQAAEQGLPINENTTLEAQMWILHRQFAEELQYSGQRSTPPHYDVLICDRAFENYCYLERRMGKDPHAFNMVLGHLNKFPYNQVYLLPIVDEAPAKNGIRAIDLNFQIDMYQRIRDFIQDQHIQTTELEQPQDPYRSDWVEVIVQKTILELAKDNLSPRGLNNG
jgi:thymidylate kinase